MEKARHARGIARFDVLAASFLAHHFAQRPSSATMHGVEGYDAASPDLSAPAWERRVRDDASWAARFAGVDDATLSADERIDRDLVLATLRGRAVMADWQEWRRTPDVYLNPATMGVFALFLRRAHPEPGLVDAAVARLAAVPELLGQARTNLDPGLAHPLLLRRGARQCRAAAAHSRDLLAEGVGEGPRRVRLAEAGAIAAEAYESFAAHLGDLEGRSGGDWAIGEARYGSLLRDRELLGIDAGELRERGRRAYDDLAAELKALAVATEGDDDFRAVLDDLAGDRPATPAAMLDGYTRCTAAARRFLVDHDLVTLPEGEECAVVPSPPFQRPMLAVASYFAPPSFAPSLRGHFNVPYPPEATTADDVARRLADNSYPSMPTTTVHEAYPGHHWHYARLQSAVGPRRPLRMVLTTPYFSEGWALYAEAMMREQGFFAEPGHELCHLDARLFRAARIVADTSLHGGDMTVEQAVTFMRDKAGLTEPVARAEVTRYCAWPTQAASYLTGALEIERLRARWTGQHGDDLRGFHDALAGSGAMPIALAERAVLG